MKSATITVDPYYDLCSPHSTLLPWFPAILFILLQPFLHHFLYAERTFLSRLFGARSIGTSPATFSPGPQVLVSRYLILAIGIASLVSFLKFLFSPITYGQSWSRARKQAVTRSMSYRVILHASEPCRLRVLPKFPAKYIGQFLLVSFHFDEQKIEIYYCLGPLNEHRSNKCLTSDH